MNKLLVQSFLFISILFASISMSNAEILVELEDEVKKETKIDFNIGTFDSCKDMNSTIYKYLKNQYQYRPIPMPRVMFSEENITDTVSLSDNDMITTWPSVKSSKMVMEKSESVISTNIQETWVDEAEIVKTDGKHLYYYNNKSNTIYIYDAKTLEQKETIVLPKWMFSIQLYLDDKYLTLIWSKYGSNKWYINDSYTYVISYDISDINNVNMKSINKVNGTYYNSRKIGSEVVLINRLNFNYYRIFNNYDKNVILDKELDEKDEETIDDDIVDIIDSDLLKTFSLTKDEKAKLVIGWQSFPYTFDYNKTDCSDINYILPDNKSDISNTSINIIYKIDISGEEKIEQNVLFWSINSIYMNQSNLYLISSVYFENPYSCRGWFCGRPYSYTWDNTLIYKYNIKDSISFKDFTLVEWRPLNQYSMYDSGSNFHIVTTWRSWNEVITTGEVSQWDMIKIMPTISRSNERSTKIFIFDDNLELTWKIDDIAKWEDFKSARFLSNERLILVTFEQIDPLFVIDISDKSNPTIEGELKIPWFSSYLHPINKDTLIWLGYDTKENQWGRTSQSWLKLDIYDISDIKNPKQKHTYTFGDSGSYTKAINNPRLFIYNPETELLSLPVSLRTQRLDWPKKITLNETFNGGIIFNVWTDWISEFGRYDHIDKLVVQKEHLKQCDNIIKQLEESQNTCYTLINWKEYCTPNRKVYIPNYCYEDSNVETFLSQNSYRFRDYYINRSVMIWNNVYFFSSKGLSLVDTLNKENNKQINIDY